MQTGKIENLRIAARLLDRTLIGRGEVFSFWKQLGPPSRYRGFVPGRMLQQGCMVPATGGGLCQLSNALYDAALTAGCEIVERHAHSRVVPGSAAERGRDATVAWNYVDLRFRSARRPLLRVRLTADELVVELRTSDGEQTFEEAALGSAAVVEGAGETCGTCNETSCFRHERRAIPTRGRNAFLVHEFWPEFADFIARHKQDGDALYLPMHGRLFRIARYGWDTAGFSRVVSDPAAVLRNSFETRRLATQGAARRAAELKSAERLARHFARRLKPYVGELCVAQSFLPFLWRDGHLGGRRFTVLMTTLPIHEMHRQLDAAATLHPERATLSDFRAPPELAELEAEALSAAERIVTPHAKIASMFGTRAVKLEWHTPPLAPVSTTQPRRRVAFPGPTVARKGCYELRDAARILNLEIALPGSELEGVGFWSGVRTVRNDAKHWLDDVSLVVQPAIVEQAPRRLLAALACGVPVIATAACGIDPQPGVTIVPAGDSEALVSAIRTHFD